jgi:hypothetical protein
MEGPIMPDLLGNLIEFGIFRDADRLCHMPTKTRFGRLRRRGFASRRVRPATPTSILPLSGEEG